MNNERFKKATSIMKAKQIIFDFEVFKYDCLFGSIIVTDKDILYYQTWDLEAIKAFYELNKNSIWIGHNNEGYDNLILQSIIFGINPYKTSKSLIENSDNGRPRLKIQLFYLDLMKLYRGGMYSLKMTEAACGKNISETEVDFNIDSELAFDEMLDTEKYNRDDLNQTYDNMLSLKDEIMIRFDLVNEFKLGLKALHYTETQLASLCLGAKKINDIEYQTIKPRLYDDLNLSNEEVKNFYLNEKFKRGEHFTINIDGSELVGGSGGAHSAMRKYHCKNALYFDVSGYYNLTMINRDLLPRTLGENGKKQYEFMYHEQLRLKKTNPKKRAVYKTILLAVFGSMKNQYTDFYDPAKGDLVMITGQLYIIDLLERLQGKINLVQTNTDGIIVEPLDWDKRDEIIRIVEEWENRTGYAIKKMPIHDIWQRDVNCYMYKTEDNEIHCVGEAVVCYNDWEDIFSHGTWQIKEPPILAHCIVEFLMNGITPEETIEANKSKLRMFQFISKKGSYDYIQYEKTYSDGHTEISKSQNINRIFPLKDKDYVGTMFKIKENKHDRVANLPNSVFIYDKDINNDYEEVMNHIDYDYYIDRAYEKIKAFTDIEFLK